MRIAAYLPLASLCVVAVMAACWPYLDMLHHWPWAPDDAVWTQASAERGLSYVFLESHFIAYRPVAALTYLLNYWVAGYSPVMYRTTDLGLFAAAIVSVGVSARVLLNDRRGWWAGAVALLFALHPVGQEIAPFLARRSYPIAVIFGMLGFALLDVAARKGSWRSPSALAAAALLALSVLSNETSYVMVPVIIAWATLRSPTLLGAARSLAPSLAALCLALTCRFLVLGLRPGGYRHKLVATTFDGRKVGAHWIDLPRHEIGWKSVDYLLSPISPRGLDPWGLLESWQALVLLVLLIVVACAASMKRDWREACVPVVLGVWCSGYALLYGLTQTWFWRQGYPMVVPLALLFVWLLRWFVQLRGRALVGGVTGVLALGVLLVPMGWHSPAWRGLDLKPIRDVRVGTEIVQAVRPVLEGLGPDDQVWLAAPMGEPGMQRAVDWLSRLSGARVRELTCTPKLGHPSVVDVGERRLTLGSAIKFCPTARRALDLPEGRGLVLPLSRLHTAEGTYLVYQREGEWTLLPIR